MTWLAYWKDSVTDSFKYVWLASSSRFKGEADIAKYTKAQELKKHIDKIRASYTADLKKKEEKVRQRATAMYLIDKLALRGTSRAHEQTRAQARTRTSTRTLLLEHVTFESGVLFALRCASSPRLASARRRMDAFTCSLVA